MYLGRTMAGLFHKEINRAMAHVMLHRIIRRTRTTYLYLERAITMNPERADTMK